MLVSHSFIVYISSVAIKIVQCKMKFMRVSLFRVKTKANQKKNTEQILTQLDFVKPWRISSNKLNDC